MVSSFGTAGFLETAWLFLAVVPFVLKILEFHHSVKASISRYKAQIRRLAKEYVWFTAWLLRHHFTQALAIMERVEQHVLHTEAPDVIAFKNSFYPSFNLVAVAVRSSLLLSLTRLSPSSQLFGRGLLLHKLLLPRFLY
jgi:hypothetical protein